MTIDPTKTYRTRDGREVRIYAVDAGGNYPVQGAIWDGGRWCMASWTVAGQSLIGPGMETDSDLIESKPRIQGWVNVYRRGGVIDSEAEFFPNKPAADAFAEGDIGNRVACIRIDVEEGEGL